MSRSFSIHHRPWRFLVVRAFLSLLCLAYGSSALRARASAPEDEGRKSEGKKAEGKSANGGAHETGPASSLPADEASDEKSPVVISGQVAEDSAGPSGVIRFWLTIENRTTLPIAKLQLTQPEIPGFRLTRLCWPASQDGKCTGVPAVLHAHFDLQDQLPPQDSLTIWGDLEAVEAKPKQVAFVTLSWTGPGHSSKTISLGQVESLSATRAFFLLFSNNWEWSFPIGLPILTYLAALWVKRREGKRKARAEELSQQQRTWSLMLKQSQAVGLKYFTPIGGSVQALRDELEALRTARREAEELQKLQNAGDPNADAAALAAALEACNAQILEACYDVLMFQRHLRQTLDDVGGYYFKNRDAESLADALYQKHRKSLDFPPDLRQDFSDAGLEMQRNTTWSEFLDWSNSPVSSVSTFCKSFQGHMMALPLAQLEAEVLILDAYAALLDYEVNRPLLYWYGKLRPIQFKFTDQDRSSRAALLQWDGDWQQKLQLTAPQVAAYQANAEKYIAAAEKWVFVAKKRKHWWSLKEEPVEE